MITLHHSETGIEMHFNPAQVSMVFLDPATDSVYIAVGGSQGSYVRESLTEVLDLLA